MRPHRDTRTTPLHFEKSLFHKTYIQLYPYACISGSGAFSRRATHEAVSKYGDRSRAVEKCAWAEKVGRVDGSAGKQANWCKCMVQSDVVNVQVSVASQHRSHRQSDSTAETTRIGTLNNYILYQNAFAVNIYPCYLHPRPPPTTLIPPHFLPGRLKSVEDEEMQGY